jgi:hypothetical protein
MGPQSPIALLGRTLGRFQSGNAVMTQEAGKVVATLPCEGLAISDQSRLSIWVRANLVSTPSTVGKRLSARLSSRTPSENGERRGRIANREEQGGTDATERPVVETVQMPCPLLSGDASERAHPDCGPLLTLGKQPAAVLLGMRVRYSQNGHRV